MSETIAGIEYKKPKVFLLQSSSLGVAEFAGRTAYDSFNKSENASIEELNHITSNYSEDSELRYNEILNNVNSIESSELLEKLVWAYCHESVVEHTNLSFLIKGISRGVLQELARHRIASYTVRSTRYTMSSVLNSFNSSKSIEEFEFLINKYVHNLFILEGEALEIEIKQLYSKLKMQKMKIGKDEFVKISSSKEQIDILNKNYEFEECFQLLEKAKQKRNVGDNFKWVVTDNWSVDLVMTVNLRSLKNFMKLRDSGAAYFQIRWLAEEMKSVIPMQFMKLIKKS